MRIQLKMRIHQMRIQVRMKMSARKRKKEAKRMMGRKSNTTRIVGLELEQICEVKYGSQTDLKRSNYCNIKEHKSDSCKKKKIKKKEIFQIQITKIFTKTFLEPLW